MELPENVKNALAQSCKFITEQAPTWDKKLRKEFLKRNKEEIKHYSHMLPEHAKIALYILNEQAKAYYNAIK